ncbi:Chloride channel protein [Paragonimus heterotremus]|uniref:Chloride channel protein n=1 Tax=Paragonimus heterotremus TaxID=100268 RepID=A0A8J4SGM5_9TREM|nr:Chloride channel protein [Paragonimus heterotremus]
MDTSALIKLLVSPCSPVDDMSICDYRINLSDPMGNVLGSYPSGPTMSTAMILLLTGLFLKLVLTIFTIGIKVPTGLFIPSLAIGAIMGRMLGVAIEQIVVINASHPFVAKMCKSSQPCISPGLYAMVGAAATLGGVSRMTISLVVMMLELTGGLNYIIPLMVATMISKWTGDRLTKGSIYEEQIRLNGYPYLGEHDELEHMWIAADVMQPSDPDSPLFVITQDGMTVLDLETLLNTSDVKGFPVVVSQQSPYLVGWVTRRDLRWALDHERHLDATINDDSPVYFTNYSCDIQVDEAGPVPLCFRNVVDLSPTTVTDQTPMETVLDFFRKLGLRQIVVTHNGCLLGILTKKDVLRHLLRHSRIR